MTDRSVVWDNCVMATTKLLDPYDAFIGSVTWKYSTPSTCNCVLSLVIQTWLGTSSGISLRMCLYATRSMNGTTMESPCVSVT